MLGYPISHRFNWDSFSVQAMQQAVLQWRPETKTVAFVNVFHRLHDLGDDPWLEAFRATPPLFDTKPDTGLSWKQVKTRHRQMLDQNASIKTACFAAADPLLWYGLPTSQKDYDDVFVVRAQCAVFQQWKVDMPWAKKDQVVIANGGDVAKDAGLFPGPAVAPKLPPSSTTPVALACSPVPVRGFGLVWSEYPELYDLLGCPGWPVQEQALDASIQRFEHGWMLWALTENVTGWHNPASKQVYVLFEDNQTFTVFPDTWAEADPASRGLTPPAGMLEPQRGFGKVWRRQPSLHEILGWATSAEEPLSRATQGFATGQMLWTSEGIIYVLYNDGAWWGLVDTFIEPRPSGASG